MVETPRPGYVFSVAAPDGPSFTWGGAEVRRIGFASRILQPAAPEPRTVTQAAETELLTRAEVEAMVRSFLDSVRERGAILEDPPFTARASAEDIREGRLVLEMTEVGRRQMAQVLAASVPLPQDAGDFILMTLPEGFTQPAAIHRAGLSDDRLRARIASTFADYLNAAHMRGLDPAPLPQIEVSNHITPARPVEYIAFRPGIEAVGGEWHEMDFGEDLSFSLQRADFAELEARTLAVAPAPRSALWDSLPLGPNGGRMYHGIEFVDEGEPTRAHALRPGDTVTVSGTGTAADGDYLGRAMGPGEVELVRLGDTATVRAAGAVRYQGPAFGPPAPPRPRRRGIRI